MIEKSDEEVRLELKKFLEKTGPQKEGQCTLYEVNTKHEAKWLVVTCYLVDNGTNILYIINDRFWYDYVDFFREYGEFEWKIRYKKVTE